VGERGEELVLRTVGGLGLGPRSLRPSEQALALLLCLLAPGDVHQDRDDQAHAPGRVMDRATEIWTSTTDPSRVLRCVSTSVKLWPRSTISR
jgi:hypothetical protein